MFHIIESNKDIYLNALKFEKVHALSIKFINILYFFLRHVFNICYVFSMSQLAAMSQAAMMMYPYQALAMAQLMGAGGSGATGGSTGSSGSGSSGKSSSSASAAAQQSAVNQMYELQRQASEQLQLQYLRDLMPSGGGLPSSWHHQGKK